MSEQQNTLIAIDAAELNRRIVAMTQSLTAADLGVYGLLLGLGALLCATVSCGRAVLIRSMAVFATMGFIASYELLRRVQGRAVAAASCLLLGSSPIIFMFSTRLVL